MIPPDPSKSRVNTSRALQTSGWCPLPLLLLATPVPMVVPRSTCKAGTRTSPVRVRPRQIWPTTVGCGLVTLLHRHRGTHKSKPSSESPLSLRGRRAVFSCPSRATAQSARIIARERCLRRFLHCACSAPSAMGVAINRGGVATGLRAPELEHGRRCVVLQQQEGTQKGCRRFARRYATECKCAPPCTDDTLSIDCRSAIQRKMKSPAAPLQTRAS